MDSQRQGAWSRVFRGHQSPGRPLSGAEWVTEMLLGSSMAST